MIFAGLPNTVPATTVSKVCGSGLQAVVFGTKTIALGDADLVLAGGMESMSNVPYYLDKARSGYRMGNGTLVDGMIFDGLWDPYSNVHMGSCGDACAKEYKFSREAQDEFAKESFRRALAAQKEGLFDKEIEPVLVPQRKGDPLAVKLDEGPAKGDPSKFASLSGLFMPQLMFCSVVGSLTVNLSCGDRPVCWPVRATSGPSEARIASLRRTAIS